VSRLSRQCGILNILQPCRSPGPVTGIALLTFLLTYSTLETDHKPSPSVVAEQLLAVAVLILMLFNDDVSVVEVNMLFGGEQIE
jgi:hypothetical protein